MTLTLTILRCPDSVPPQTREVAGGEFSIGRGPGNDWVLPDPDRHMSKRHCLLAFRAGGWQIADLSSNGTFLNRDPEPIGPGAVRELRDGDRLRFAAYEIELRIAEPRAAPPPRNPLQAVLRAMPDPFADDPLAPRTGGAPGANPFDGDPLIQPSAQEGAASIGLPADYDALASDPSGRGFAGPVQSDHSPRLQDAFQAPLPTPFLLPDDWDSDLSRVVRSSPAVAPAPARAVAPPPAPPAGAGDLMAAFLRGAGLPDARPADPEAAMEALGRSFRAFVSGLRAALIARAEIKGEFRIEQTMIRARGNNPLKFAADDDDALAALVGAGRRADMGPDEAVAEALREMRLHELASLAAMQGAARALVARFDPAKLLAEAQGGLSLLPAQRKARAWDGFESLHARTAQALSDDWDSVFGRAFALAYERALREIGDKDPA